MQIWFKHHSNIIQILFRHHTDMIQTPHRLHVERKQLQQQINKKYKRKTTAKVPRQQQLHWEQSVHHEITEGVANDAPKKWSHRCANHGRQVHVKNQVKSRNAFSIPSIQLRQFQSLMMGRSSKGHKMWHGTTSIASTVRHLNHTKILYTEPSPETEKLWKCIKSGLKPRNRTSEDEVQNPHGVHVAWIKDWPWRESWQNPKLRFAVEQSPWWYLSSNGPTNAGGMEPLSARALSVNWTTQHPEHGAKSGDRKLWKPVLMCIKYGM